MALMINEECIACGECMEECPNDAIVESEELYFVDPNKCTECEGKSEKMCASICPVDACVLANN